MGCGGGAETEELQLSPGARRPRSALHGDGVPSSPGPAGLSGLGREGGGRRSSQASGSGEGAGGRPRPVLDASLPSAEPPEPGAEVWGPSGPPLLHPGPEPVPDAGRLKTRRGGGIHPAPRPDCETRESPENSLRV